MESLLPTGLLWLRPFLPYLPTLSIDTSTLCSIDPPDPPTLEPLDLVALFDPTRTALKSLAVSKITQWVLNAAWYQLCRCVDLSTPTSTTYPSAPSPLPVINPTGTTLPGTADPCQVRQFSWIPDPYFSPIYQDAVFATPAQPQQWPLPNSPADWSDFTVDIVPGGAVHAATPVMRIDYFSSPGGSPIGQQILNFSDNVPVRFTPTTGASHYQMLARFSASGNVTDTFHATVRHYCNAASPGAPLQGCCPPDPTIQATLAAVLELTTLVQRQLAPFAFIEGTMHSGLTGNGEFSLDQPIVGVRIFVLDSLAGTVGVDDGHPETLYGLGWLRWGDSDGWRERVPIDTEALISTPYAASAMTKIGYSLPPGVEIDVVELEREP